MRFQIIAAPLAALGLAVTMVAARPVAAAVPPVTSPVVETLPLPVAAPAPVPYRLEIGGHRGGVDKAPENTLAAVRKAIGSGADSVEIDVRYTADGRPVILHDDTLQRTTNCRGYVARWKLSKLLRCDAGSWFNRSFGDERVPTLAEALELVRPTNVKLYLHVKLVEDLIQATTLVTSVALSGIAPERIVFAADEHERLERLELVGVPRERLAWVVHRRTDWSDTRPRWGTLVVHCPKLTRQMVDRARARGQRVIAVEGFPITRKQAEDLRLDGFLADRLQAALAYGK